MSFIEGEITVEFGGTVGPAGPAGNAVPIAAGTVLANPSGVLANPVGVDAAGMRALIGAQLGSANLTRLDGTVLNQRLALGVVAREIETVAALTGIAEILNGEFVDLTGYYATGDSGSQRLVYRSTGRASNNITSNPAFGGWYFNGPGADDYFEALEKHEVIAKRFGVRGNGVADDSARLQAAVDTCISAFDAETMRGAKELKLDSGIYLINSPILIRSGVKITGTGPGVEITKGSSWSGASAFVFTGGTNAYCSYVQISQIAIVGDFVAFTTGSNTRTLATTTSLLESSFEDIQFRCTDGFVVTYAQTCTFRNISSYGNINRFFDIGGNFLTFANCNKESGTSSTDGPWVHIHGYILQVDAINYPNAATAISIHDLLVQGNGDAGKTPLKLDNCAAVSIDGFWVEVPSCLDNVAIDIIDCEKVVLGPKLYLDVYKMKVRTTQSLIIESANTVNSGGTLESYLDVDSASGVLIKQLLSLNGEEVFRLSDAAKSIVIDHVANRQIAVDNLPGLSKNSQLGFSGGNLLVNPSFESGAHGWTFAPYPGVSETVTFPSSETGDGLQLSCTLSPANSRTDVYQNVDVKAGTPYTLSCLAKVTSGNSWLNLVIIGQGVDASSRIYNRAEAGAGWCVITQTFIPVTSGLITVGFQAINITTFAVDKFSLCVGTQAQPDGGVFQSMQLRGRTIDGGSAAPTTGTWRNGDFRFSDDHTAGLIGWQCTVSGTPGTWQTVHRGVGVTDTLSCEAITAGGLWWLNLAGNNYLSGITYFRDGSGVTTGSFNGNTGILTQALTTPASAAATGVAGTITADANYVYVCTATNTWKRVAIATW
jgi:hypothetical protein